MGGHACKKRRQIQMINYINSKNKYSKSLHKVKSIISAMGYSGWKKLVEIKMFKHQCAGYLNGILEQFFQET